MYAEIEMVYSACVEWFNDWVSADPPVLRDMWDLAQWMEQEMHTATQMFLENAFHTPRARNDAIMILRALYYEYFLFQEEAARRALTADLTAPTRLPVAPQTAQKTAAWHAESRDMLSGHEFGGVTVGGPAEYNKAVEKKCGRALTVEDGDEEIESQTVYLTPADGTLSPFKWGWRYEPVARDLFERCFAGGKVFDGLGRLKHPSLPRLGASPDGLIMDGPRAGRLVELKCPISRELNGSVPVKYWVQMQLQAEVCNVAAVEYFEVALGTSPTMCAAMRESKLPWIGKIFVVAACPESPTSDYKYVYSPLFAADAPDACEAWAAPEGVIVLETAYWWVKDYHTTSVLRNQRWWSAIGQPAYEKFWEDVDAARTAGTYKPRALFVDDDDADYVSNAAARLAATPQTANDIEFGADDYANDADDEATASDAGTQSVAESSPVTAQENIAQSDTPIDSESA